MSKSLRSIVFSRGMRLFARWRLWAVRWPVVGGMVRRKRKREAADGGIINGDDGSGWVTTMSECVMRPVTGVGVDPFGMDHTQSSLGNRTNGSGGE